MEDLKKKVEAILFSVGKKITQDKLKSLCGIKNDADLISALNELKEDYNKNSSPMMIINDGENWKLTVRENYLHLVRNIVTDTDLTKSVTETLAVIAFKYPLSQAELIKIRSNKAYDHVKQLKEMQFVEKVKRGRTYDIKLTHKFFEYFDLPEKKVKETFSNFEEVENVITEKEEEYMQAKKKVEQENQVLKEKLQENKKSESDYMEELDAMAPTQETDLEEEINEGTENHNPETLDLDNSEAEIKLKEN
ncbi:MAG: SMC-Scp complex subunit ScpB [Nanoarchaeota archaeon]|nr:SMC-Scp complex subunit ScpB [Nanoarchaeota archaeon]